MHEIKDPSLLYGIDRFKRPTGPISHERLSPDEKWKNEIGNTLMVLESHLLLNGHLDGDTRELWLFLTLFIRKVGKHKIKFRADWARAFVTISKYIILQRHLQKHPK